MRRFLVTTAALCALAAPAVAAAKIGGPADGTLVVRNGDNGDGIVDGARPVVTLVVTGFVIGRVSGQGRIEIYDLDPTDTSTPEVTGAGPGEPIKRAFSDSGPSIEGSTWSGATPFTFRAVDGTYRVVVYGSGVYLFAGGHGKVWFTGQPSQNGSAPADGTYSLNGGAWTSLPVSTPKAIAVGSSG